MSVIHNQRLIAKICEMYYLLNMSQKEIASRLNISRPHICRILSQARENGMVEIRINNPYYKETVIEQQLIEKYSLEDALVISSEGTNSGEQMTDFFRETAEYLDTCLTNGMNLGVMSGKTVSTIATNMKNGGKRLGMIVPLVGGLGATNPELHASYIAMQIAAIYGGTPLVLNAPLVMSNAKTASIMKREVPIAEVLKLGRNCDAAIIGIGNVDKNSTTAKVGGISDEDIDKLRDAGAVCSVCNSYFDENSHEVDVITEKSIGVGLKEIKRGRIIACAFGEDKTTAIHAALKTRYINTLITNSVTASELLQKY